jgi:hypothetical protein
VGHILIHQGFHGQHVDNAHSNRRAANKNPYSIQEARQQNRSPGFQRIGVDYGCDRVGGIVKPVDEFECTDAQKAQNQQN